MSGWASSGFPLLYEIITRQSVRQACEPQDNGSMTGAGSQTDEVSSRSRRFYPRQAQGLKIHFAQPPIHPGEQYLRIDRRRQLIHTVWVWSIGYRDFVTHSTVKDKVVANAFSTNREAK